MLLLIVIPLIWIIFTVIYIRNNTKKKKNGIKKGTSVVYATSKALFHTWLFVAPLLILQLVCSMDFYSKQNQKYSISDINIEDAALVKSETLADPEIQCDESGNLYITATKTAEANTVYTVPSQYVDIRIVDDSENTRLETYEGKFKRSLFEKLFLLDINNTTGTAYNVYATGVEEKATSEKTMSAR